MRVFGYAETYLRLPSVIAGLGAVYMAGRLGSKLFDRETGCLTAFFMAISAYFLQSSNEIRPYSILCFMALCTVFFMLKAEKKARYLIPYVLLSGLITYVEHIGVFVLLACGLYAINSRSKPVRLSQVLIGLFQIPWVFLVTRQASGNEQILNINRVSEYWNFGWMVKKYIGFFWHIFLGYDFSMITIKEAFFGVMEPLFLIQAILCIISINLVVVSFFDLRKSKYFWLIFNLSILPFLLMFIIYPIRLEARYLSFSAPLFIMLAVDLVRSLYGGTAFFLMIFFTASNLYSAGVFYALKTDPIHREDFKSMVRLVNKDLQSAAVVGSQYHKEYFKMFLNLKDCSYFGSINDINGDFYQGYDHVWVLSQINMHKKVTDRILAADKEAMRKKGFVLAKKEQFGELTLASLYIKEMPND